MQYWLEDERGSEGGAASQPSGLPVPASKQSMKKRPLVVRLVGAALALVLLWHGLATVIYLSGSSTLANVAGKGTINAYMTPLFKQYWSVFAPDPVHEDTALHIRAKVNGTQTDWFDVSAVDVDRSILHQPVPSRLYLTNFQLTSHYQVSAGLLPAGVAKVPTQDFTGNDWLEKLSAALSTSGADASDAAAVKQFIKDETAMTNMTSSLARARWGEGATEVQLKITTTPVVPFAERRNPDYKNTATEYDAGWRQVVKVPGIDLAPIAAMYGTEAVAANAGK